MGLLSKRSHFSRWLCMGLENEFAQLSDWVINLAQDTTPSYPIWKRLRCFLKVWFCNHEHQTSVTTTWTDKTSQSWKIIPNGISNQIWSQSFARMARLFISVLLNIICRVCNAMASFTSKGLWLLTQLLCERVSTIYTGGLQAHQLPPTSSAYH